MMRKKLGTNNITNNSKQRIIDHTTKKEMNNTNKIRCVLITNVKLAARRKKIKNKEASLIKNII